MSRNGEARKAPDIALYASCFADFVSNLSLILLAGLLASFALRFGPPEYFTLVVFSLTIIAGIAGNHMAKGMISAGLGLLLATIGLDLVYGTSRLVFCEVDLMAVLNFIPVLIGLFALPEIIDYYARRTGLLGQVQALAGDPATFAEFRRCFKSILRGSVIGVVLDLGISKRGDRYLRSLLIHGARAALRTASARADRRSQWAFAAPQRRGANVATGALANRNLRTAWALLTQGT